MKMFQISLLELILIRVRIPEYRVRCERYKAQAVATWTAEYQEAECLYLILSAIRENDSNALSQFSAGETGDTDGDGMRELLDSWKRPIKLSRRIDGVLIYSAGIDKLDPADDITNHD